MSALKQWPRKVECTLCTEPHQVDARGFKQHQNKIRSEQGASVAKNDPADVGEYRRGFADGWRMALEETGVILTRAA